MFALRLGGVPTSREAACLWKCLEVPPGGCEGSPPRLTDKTRGGVCLTTATKARWWGGGGGGDGGGASNICIFLRASGSKCWLRCYRLLLSLSLGNVEADRNPGNPEFTSVS